jgi:hypothetical protein
MLSYLTTAMLTGAVVLARYTLVSAIVVGEEESRANKQSKQSVLLKSLLFLFQLQWNGIQAKIKLKRKRPEPGQTGSGQLGQLLPLLLELGSPSGLAGQWGPAVIFLPTNEGQARGNQRAGHLGISALQSAPGPSLCISAADQSQRRCPQVCMYCTYNNRLCWTRWQIRPLTHRMVSRIGIHLLLKIQIITPIHRNHLGASTLLDENNTLFIVERKPWQLIGKA